MMCLRSFINYNIYHSGGGVGNGDNALVGARNIWEIFVAEKFLELLPFYYVFILFSSLRSPFLVILVGCDKLLKPFVTWEAPYLPFNSK